MRIIELYSNVRDKNCASEMLTQSDTGEVTSMFVPWNRDPETFSAPQTWSKTTLWNGQIEVRIGQEIGTDGPHVLRTRLECEVTGLWSRVIGQDSRDRGGAGTS